MARKKKLIRRKGGKQLIKSVLPSPKPPSNMKVMSASEVRKRLAGREGSTSQVIDDTVVSKGLKKKKKSTVPKSTNTQKKGANLAEGSGMGSQPKGGPKNIVGRSEEKTMVTAMPDKEKNKLARLKAAKGSFDVAQKLKPGTRAALRDEFDKMTKPFQRKEAIRFLRTGKQSKFASLFSNKGGNWGPAELKSKSDKSILALVGLGGVEYLSKKYKEHKKNKKKPVVKRKASGPTKPKVKTPAWMKGLSEDQIKEMISGPHPSGERRAKVKKKPSKTRKAKAGGIVKKRDGGMTRQGLSPAEEARAGTMSQAKRKKYMNKGGLVKRKKPGKIGSGDKFVRDCYK